MREARGRRASCRSYRSAHARLTAQGRITMKFAALCTMLVLMLAAQTGFGQEKPYKEGSVWTVTFVKVKPGMMDTYLRDLGANRKKLMEQAKHDGLIPSERLLSGEATGRAHFDLILMVEVKHWAAFDGLSHKLHALPQ